MYCMRLALLFSLTLFWSCDSLELNKKEFESLVNEPIVRYREAYNVRFGNNEFQTFDIFYPENAYGNPSDVVMLLHGGGWVYGDKWFLQPSVDALKKARKNLTIVNVNYRLIATDPKKTLFDLQMADLDSCVSYLKRNVAKYNIRSDKFALMGASAGAHLALSYAYTLGKSKIHTVVGMSAITELSSASETLTPTLWGGIVQLTGYKEGDPDKTSLLRASPVHLASVDSPRTILLYGMLDESINMRQQTLLCERLTALRVPNALYTLKDQNHNVEAEHVAEGILGSLGADEFDRYTRSY
jgi:glycerophosphoryl diester phosphodiesterase